jgi:O-antigen/teichoic acid export membrane protein
MVALCFSLISRWGLVGAAVAAAVTNIGTNVWNLVEVRSALKLSPYNRSYLKILPSIGGALLVTLVVRNGAAFLRKDWIAILVAAVSAYAVFSAVALSIGLDADDRLIANAVWARVRGAFG